MTSNNPPSPKHDQRERKEDDETNELRVDDGSTDYGDAAPDEKPEFDERPSKQGHSGKNILSGVKPATSEEQREHVSKSKSTPKENFDEPGRVTKIENELRLQQSVIRELNTNITKMMFIIVVLSICLAAFKAGSLIYDNVNIQNIVELLIAVLLSYFGVNSTYKYTKEHPEAGNPHGQLAEATKEVANDFVEGLTGYVLVKKKSKKE